MSDLKQIRVVAAAMAAVDEDWCCDKCRDASVDDGFYDRQAQAALAAIDAAAALNKDAGT